MSLIPLPAMLHCSSGCGELQGLVLCDSCCRLSWVQRQDTALRAAWGQAALHGDMEQFGVHRDRISQPSPSAAVSVCKVGR